MIRGLNIKIASNELQSPLLKLEAYIENVNKIHLPKAQANQDQTIIKIVNERLVSSAEGILRTEYLVKWLNSDEETWERPENIYNKNFIERYLKSKIVYNSILHQLLNMPGKRYSLNFSLTLTLFLTSFTINH